MATLCHIELLSHWLYLERLAALEVSAEVISTLSAALGKNFASPNLKQWHNQHGVGALSQTFEILQ